MVPQFIHFYSNMMSMETPSTCLLLRLISSSLVLYLPCLCNPLTNKGNPFRDNLRFNKGMLLAHKDNPFKDNLQPSKGMCMTHKGNPYKDNLRSNKDCFTACKGSLTILKVNLYKLSL